MKGFINYIKDNRILLAAMAVVFVLCLVVTGTRYSIEGKNKTYDIVLDYSEIAAMAIQTDHDVSWWLGKFKEMGITKVGLIEESLLSMMEDVNINLTSRLMDQITKDASWRLHYPQELLDMLDSKGFIPFDILVEIDGEDTAAFVISAIEQRFKTGEYQILDMGEKAYVIVYGTPDVTLYSQKYKYMNSLEGGFIERVDIESSKIMFISLGLWPEKVGIIKNLGMEIVPRTMSYKGWNDTKFAKAVIGSYAGYDIIPEYLIAGGEAVIGFDDGVELARDYVLENGITVGLIENTTQLQNILQSGIVDITAQSEFDAVRVFSVWDYIQKRYEYYGYKGAEEIENTLFRAVTERNVRLIYFKPILHFKDLHTYVTDVSVYEDLFASLERRLAEHGIGFGPASVMDAYRVPQTFKVLFGIGAVLGAVLLIRSFWPIRERYAVILAVLGSLCVPAAFYIMPNTSELIASFAAAIVFGCLGATFFTAMAKLYSEKYAKDVSVFKVIAPCLLTLIAAVVIALLGGLLTAAPISSIGYLLEMDIFRGVKVAQLIPIAYFAVAYLAYFGYSESKTKPGKLEYDDIKNLLSSNIKLWMLFIAVILGGAGAYYIMRTGHDSSIEVSRFEMLARNELENILIARPRTKEFLISFPSVMMMVYCAVRRFKKWSIIFGIAGVVGITSVINTFQHLRTPLYLGFARTGYSLLFGIITGILAMLVFEGLYILYDKRLRKYVEAAPDV